MHFLRHFLSDSPSSLTQPLNKAFHYAFRVTFPQGGGNYKNCYYENTTIFSFLCCTMKLGLWWKKAIGEGSVESSEIEWRAGGWGKSRLANISITRLKSHHVMGKNEITILVVRILFTYLHFADNGEKIPSPYYWSITCL